MKYEINSNNCRLHIKRRKMKTHQGKDLTNLTLHHRCISRRDADLDKGAL